MPSPEDSPSDRPPKLTIGQRVLAAMPNLDRSAKPGAASDAPAASGVADDAAAREADAALEPDEVLEADEVLSPDDTQTARARSSVGAGAVRPTMRVNPFADYSVPELRAAMKGLDDRERRLPLVLGPVVAALDVALTFITLHDNPPLHHKNHADPAQILIIGLATACIALLVTVSAFFRRRSFTIFALLFCGLGGGLITMLPAWGVAFWLFSRFNRIQKTLVSKTGGPAGARQRSAEARAARDSQRRKPRTSGAAPAGPALNKRYTPPKPTKPRPPSA